MPQVRPFAYNTGTTIEGTTQVGNLAVVSASTEINSGFRDYSGNFGGVDWWMGPDEELGYVIAYENPSGQSNPTSKTAKVQFWRSSQFTDSNFVSLANSITNNSQNFSNGNTAVSWLNNNGYWTSYVPPTPTPTQTTTQTPTLTVTPTQTFTQTPTQTPTPSTTPTNLTVDYLVVAGGGGGGADNRAMGGSGAGGFLSGSTEFTPNQTYTVTVGAGGTKLSTSSATPGNKGNNSSITGTSISIISFGGGATSPGGGVENGGSGAGASVFSTGISNALGTGISGQGNNGGNGCTLSNCGTRYAGGGGGAGAVGQDGSGSNGGGDGGNGLTWYNGSTYAGGGGGSTFSNANAGSGGNGGGGNGSARLVTAPTDGGINTGGGAGGGTLVSVTAGGGSGIVIIRYSGLVQKANGGTVTTSGGYTYHTFTGTGTFIPT